MKTIAWLFLMLIAGLTLAQDRVQTTVAEFIRINEGFETFNAALERAGLVELLEGDGPYTIFVPTNDAFEELPEADLQALLANPATLRQLLAYHIVPERVQTSAMGAQGLQPTTLAERSLTLTASGGEVRVDDRATLVARDIRLDNGVIHVLDAVLSPGRSSR